MDSNAVGLAEVNYRGAGPPRRRPDPRESAKRQCRGSPVSDPYQIGIIPTEESVFFRLDNRKGGCSVHFFEGERRVVRPTRRGRNWVLRLKKGETPLLVVPLLAWNVPGGTVLEMVIPTVGSVWL